MKGWETACAILGFFFGIASGIVVAFSGALFGESAMGQAGASVFWISFLILALGFLAWIPRRWFRWLVAAGMFAIAIYGLIANGLFFILAAAFTVVAAVLVALWKPTRPTQSPTSA